MPDLLFELLSEEIPARMQPGAAENLRKLVTDALVERGLVYEGAKAIATPRRLALVVQGLPAKQPDTREEKKGPRVGAPDAAIAGFLKSAGLADIAQASIETDAKKGDFYVAVIAKAGRPTIEVLAEVLPRIVRAFPWPKSMRWGEGTLRWVRPLHAIVATFGPETEEPEIVPFEVDGIRAGDITFGHRFMAPGPIKVKRWDDYLSKLEAAKVIADPEKRKAIVLGDARTLAFAQGFELVDDPGLVEEVTGLVEWPVALMGKFDEAYLDIPAEVIRATIRANQKCFVLKDSKTGALANRFVAVANIVASDGGKAIVAGNARVIRARLADALYFWQTDRKPLPDAGSEPYREAAEALGLDLAKPLDQRMAKLAAQRVVFHEKLGTQAERVRRIAALAEELAPLVGADKALARRAALLAKADLTSEVVGEFPELQGAMGRKYAALQGEHASVCAAIEEHYKPQGPSDRVPTDKVSVAVALADKLDTLVGFWAIDEKPTGSKDPYALRRAALGVIRLVVENGIKLQLFAALARPFARVARSIQWSEFEKRKRSIENLSDYRVSDEQLHAILRELASGYPSDRASAQPLIDSMRAAAIDLLAFFADRLKVQLREQGARHDLVDAVFALDGQDDLLMIVRRVEALGAFLASEDGASLLAGVRRAANILRIEEKKDGRAFTGTPDPKLLSQAEETALAQAIATAKTDAEAAVAREDFAGAMAALAKLRAPVDAFFDTVTVNADDKAVRENRLKLLDEIRRATRAVADFSKIEG